MRSDHRAERFAVDPGGHLFAISLRNQSPATAAAAAAAAAATAMLPPPQPPLLLPPPLPIRCHRQTDVCVLIRPFVRPCVCMPRRGGGGQTPSIAGHGPLQSSWYLSPPALFPVARGLLRWQLLAAAPDCEIPGLTAMLRACPSTASHTPRSVHTSTNI